MPETKRKDKNAKPDGEVIIVFTRVYVVPVDRCLAGLELTVQGFYGREYCGIEIILFHILNDARPGNVIAFHIREISLQSFSRGYKIPAVIYRNDNHQATPRFLVAYSLLIANILRHAEAVSIFHMVDDDKHRLDATLRLQPPEVDVCRISVGWAHQIFRIAHIPVAVLQMNHWDIIRRPYLGMTKKHAKDSKDKKEQSPHFMTIALMIRTSSKGRSWSSVSTASIAPTTDNPLTTSPKTVYCPSSHGVPPCDQ